MRAGSDSRVFLTVARWLSQRQMQCLRWELTEILESEDDVLMIPLCSRCVERLEVTHSAERTPDWPDAPASHEIV